MDRLQQRLDKFEQIIASTGNGRQREEDEDRRYDYDVYEQQGKQQGKQQQQQQQKIKASLSRTTDSSSLARNNRLGKTRLNQTSRGALQSNSKTQPLDDNEVSDDDEPELVGRSKPKIKPGVSRAAKAAAAEKSSRFADYRKASLEAVKNAPPQPSDVQFIYKTADGKVLNSAVEEAKKTATVAAAAAEGDAYPKLDYDLMGATSLAPPPSSPTPARFSSPLSLPPIQSAVPQQRSYSTFASPQSHQPSKKQQASSVNSDFCDVLDRGSIHDVAKLMESVGPRPEHLSASTRNRLYDVISTLLYQRNNVERCLIWVLALSRSKENLLHDLVSHTRKDLVESLELCATEPSKRGLLASLLKSQLMKS